LACLALKEVLHEISEYPAMAGGAGEKAEASLPLQRIEKAAALAKG